MSLATLPPEILWEVVKRVKLLDLHRLAVTCPRLLWVILNTSCIREVVLDFNPRELRVPPLISKFPEIRSLKMSGRDPPLNLDERYLLTISKSVTSLELDYQEAIKLLLPRFSGYNEYTWSVFALQPTRRALTHFTALSKLVVFLNEGTVAPLIASVLPPSLTHLEFKYTLYSSFRLFEDKIPFPTTLPTGLQVLILPKCRVFDGTSLAHFEQLETLHIPFVGSIPTLPPSITDLSLHYLPDWLHSRNALVRKLKIDTLPSPTAVYPSHLTDLHINARNVDAAIVSNLPRSIQRLTVQDMAQSILPAKISYPPALIYFAPGSLRMESKESIAALPRGLQVLQSYLSGDFSSVLSMMPQSLTTCPIKLEINSPVDFRQCFPNMTYLTLSISDGAKPLVFPLRLSHLTAYEDKKYQGILINELLGHLPATLTSLTLESKMPVSRIFPVSSFPFGLRVFCLKILSSDPIGNDNFDMTALPKHLHSLTLSAKFSPDYDASFVHKLPVDLRYLELRGLSTITDELIRYLPQNLEYLKIVNSTRLTDACLPHLPPLLVTLALPLNRNITPMLLKVLPRYLTSVEMRSNRNFPRALHKTVPKGLSIVTWKLHKH